MPVGGVSPLLSCGAEPVFRWILVGVLCEPSYGLEQLRGLLSGLSGRRRVRARRLRHAVVRTRPDRLLWAVLEYFQQPGQLRRLLEVVRGGSGLWWSSVPGAVPGGDDFVRAVLRRPNVGQAPLRRLLAELFGGTRLFGRHMCDGVRFWDRELRGHMS